MTLSNKDSAIFDAIASNDLSCLQACLTDMVSPNVNIFDEDMMTPLQHAAYKGNKEIVQLLLDNGADPNLCKHQHNYTALHFAGLSGNVDVCLALLAAGANAAATNAVNRTPSQMAAFVGHHHCVAIINNYITKTEIDQFTAAGEPGSSPLLPQFLADSLHKFVLQINIHPVRVAMNLFKFPGLSLHLPQIKNVLDMMSQKEMKKGAENNEVLSFKFHYLAYITGEIINITKKGDNNPDTVFAKFVLKPNKLDQLDTMNALLKDCIKEFPFKECTLLRQMVAALTTKDPPSAYSVITSAINGQRGFIDNTPTCQTCGSEKPTKKCSKCKSVQYCDRDCQVMHWHWHKKICAKLSDSDKIPAKPNLDNLNQELHDILSEERN